MELRRFFVVRLESGPASITAGTRFAILECRGKKTITPSRYYACRRVEVLLVAPNFDSKATLLDADIQWAVHMSSLETCLKETLDMTCYTEAYFDILFGVVAISELPVPNHDTMYLFGRLILMLPGKQLVGSLLSESGVTEVIDDDPGANYNNELKPCIDKSRFTRTRFSPLRIIRIFRTALAIKRSG
jgi:hypothetical protein